jgi:hypothetical protein
MVTMLNNDVIVALIFLGLAKGYGSTQGGRGSSCSPELPKNKKVVHFLLLISLRK